MSGPDCPKTDVPGRRTRWAQGAILGSVYALVIAIYAFSARSGMLELWGTGPEDTYYNLLVQGFRSGQLNLKAEVPAGLSTLADPYDSVANTPYRWLGHAVLDDMSYYRGKLYLYFGVTPALLLFWPYAALTGHFLLHKFATLIFFSVAYAAGVGLLWSVWWRCFAEVPFSVVLAGALALGLAGFAPAILGRSDVYEVAISCGQALVILSLLALWRALSDSPRRWLWLVAASLTYALAVGSRPSLLPGAIILLLPVVQAWRSGQRRWPLIACTLGPIALIVLGLMLYNALRFENPFEFGQRYQLGGARQDRIRQFGLQYLWFNFRICFLEPAHWTLRFPFVRDISPPRMPEGAVIEHPFGVLTNLPWTWLALAAPMAWRHRSTNDRSILRALLSALVSLFVTTALVLCVHNSVCLRYEVEFALPLSILAVIGILSLERALAGAGRGRLFLARCGWGLLLAFSVVFGLCATCERHVESHLNLGHVLSAKGRLDQAIDEYQKAFALEPYRAEVPLFIGTIRLRTQQLDEGIACYRRALKIRPDFAIAHYDLASALLLKREVPEAVAHFQKALELEPGNGALQNNLAWLLATSPDASIRNGAKAVELAQQAVRVSGGNDPEVIGTLAAAYAENGQFDEAIATVKRAIELAGARANTALANGLRGHLERYQAGLPLRDENPAVPSPATVLP